LRSTSKIARQRENVKIAQKLHWARSQFSVGSSKSKHPISAPCHVIELTNHAAQWHGWAT